MYKILGTVFQPPARHDDDDDDKKLGLNISVTKF